MTSLNNTFNTTDIVVRQSNNIWDLVLDEKGDLANDDFFDSSLIYSILGERRASASEVPESNLRRGWIGNEDQDFENGSKVWLFEQARITRRVLNGIQSAAFNGLNWLIDDGILINVEVAAVLKDGIVSLEITLFRSNSKVDRRFFQLWENTGIN